MSKFGDAWERAIIGDRGGSTYDHDLDFVRLNKQAAIVWGLMRDGHWHTLAEIAETTGYPEASISARLRDFRKARFGSHTVERERDTTVPGLFHYRLVANIRSTNTSSVT